jgi:hypothetical protein
MNDILFVSLDEAWPDLGPVLRMSASQPLEGRKDIHENG